MFKVVHVDLPERLMLPVMPPGVIGWLDLLETIPHFEYLWYI